MHSTTQQAPADSPSPDATHLGRRVRQMRMDRGWTQMHVAVELGGALSTIQRLEQVGSCTLETITKLARLFGITVDALLAPPTPAELTAPVQKPAP